MRIDDYCTLNNGALLLKERLQHFSRHNVLTDNIIMKQQLDMLDRLGAANIPLTIRGEKGCGKDIIAEYAHLVSNRKNEPFLKINCAYLTDEQIGLELFGSSTARGDGLLKRAAGGILYIENANVLTPKMQYRLLNFITSEEGTALNIRYFVGLDSADTENTSLTEPFALHFNALTFDIPPLKERPEDILLLSLQQLMKIREEYGLERQFTPHVMEAILAYDWPGNIRQLINAIDRMAFFCDTTLIDSVSLLHNSLSTRHRNQNWLTPEPSSKTKSLKELSLEYEVMIIKKYIEELGSLRKAASALKTSPSVLSSKLTKYYASASATDKVF